MTLRNQIPVAQPVARPNPRHPTLSTVRAIRPPRKNLQTTAKPLPPIHAVGDGNDEQKPKKTSKMDSSMAPEPDATLQDSNTVPEPISESSSADKASEAELNSIEGDAAIRTPRNWIRQGDLSFQQPPGLSSTSDSNHVYNRRRRNALAPFYTGPILLFAAILGSLAAFMGSIARVFLWADRQFLAARAAVLSQPIPPEVGVPELQVEVPTSTPAPTLVSKGSAATAPLAPTGGFRDLPDFVWTALWIAHGALVVFIWSLEKSLGLKVPESHWYTIGIQTIWILGASLAIRWSEKALKVAQTSTQWLFGSVAVVIGFWGLAFGNILNSFYPNLGIHMRPVVQSANYFKNPSLLDAILTDAGMTIPDLAFGYVPFTLITAYLIFKKRMEAFGVLACISVWQWVGYFAKHQLITQLMAASAIYCYTAFLEPRLVETNKWPAEERGWLFGGATLYLALTTWYYMFYFGVVKYGTYTAAYFGSWLALAVFVGIPTAIKAWRANSPFAWGLLYTTIWGAVASATLHLPTTSVGFMQGSLINLIMGLCGVALSVWVQHRQQSMPIPAGEEWIVFRQNPSDGEREVLNP